MRIGPLYVYECFLSCGFYTSLAAWVSAARSAVVLSALFLSILMPNDVRAKPQVGSDNHERAVLKRLERIAKNYDLPSVSVLVSQGDRQTVTNYHHADVEQQIVYGLGSTTKLLSSALVLSRVEGSTHLLNKPLHEYIESEVLERYPELGLLGLEDLLRHESGLTDYANNPEWLSFVVSGSAPKTFQEKLQSILKKNKIEIKTTNSFSYSNTNYLVLEHVMEVLAAGDAVEAFNGFYKSHDLNISIPREPLLLKAYFANAKNRVNEVSVLNEYYGFDGGAYSSPVELVKLLQKLFTSESVLSSETKNVMLDWRPMAPRTIAVGDGEITHYGLGVMKLQYRGNTLIGHMGGTLKYQCFAFYDAENDTAFVLITNGSGRYYNNGFFQELVPEILDIHY